jgi:heme oxygenase
MKNELLADHLKAITLDPHQELEKVLIHRMRAMKSLKDYIELLQAFYGYFGSVEDRVNIFIGSTELPDYLLRRKSESLIKDIASLGGSLPEKATIEQIPVIGNHLQAFGALYVMEGSTLGGQVICKMLIKQLGIGEKGLSFFQSYGDHLTTMWDTFKVTLNRQAEKAGDAEIIIAAANSTFKQFKTWLDNH